MAELTEEERAKLPDSAFADPEKRAYPIHDEEHAKAALARVKQNGAKDEQKKVAKKVHERYPKIQLGEYFLALLGLVMVMGLVGDWVRMENGQYKFVQHPGPVAVPKNRNARAAALRSVAHPPVPTRTAAYGGGSMPTKAPRPPLHATGSGKVKHIRGSGLARSGHMPAGRLMGGGFGGMGRMGGWGGFGRR
jgi:hypothetical protein